MSRLLKHLGFGGGKKNTYPPPRADIIIPQRGSPVSLTYEYQGSDTDSFTADQNSLQNSPPVLTTFGHGPVSPKSKRKEKDKDRLGKKRTQKDNVMAITATERSLCNSSTMSLSSTDSYGSRGSLKGGEDSRDVIPPQQTQDPPMDGAYSDVVDTREGEEGPEEMDIQQEMLDTDLYTEPYGTHRPTRVFPEGDVSEEEYDLPYEFATPTNALAHHSASSETHIYSKTQPVVPSPAKVVNDPPEEMYDRLKLQGIHKDRPIPIKPVVLRDKTKLSHARKPNKPQPDDGRPSNDYDDPWEFSKTKTNLVQVGFNGNSPVEPPNSSQLAVSSLTTGKEQPPAMTAEADPRPAADYEQPWEYNKKKSVVFENMPANPDPVDGSLQHIDYTKKSNRISRQISGSEVGKMPSPRQMSFDSGADVPLTPAPITVTDHRGQGAIATGATDTYEDPWDLAAQQNKFENKLQNKHGRPHPLPRAASVEHATPHPQHQHLKVQQSLPNYEDPWDLESRQKEFESKLTIKSGRKDAEDIDMNTESERKQPSDIEVPERHVYDLFEKQTSKDGKVNFSQFVPPNDDDKQQHMSRKSHSQSSIKNRKSYKMATGDLTYDPEIMDLNLNTQGDNQSQVLSGENVENSPRQLLPLQRIQSIKNRDSYRLAVGDVDIVQEEEDSETGGNKTSDMPPTSGIRTPPQPPRPPKPKCSTEPSPVPDRNIVLKPKEQEQSPLTDADARPSEDYEDPWDIKSKRKGTPVSQLLAGGGNVAVVHPNVQKSSSNETLGERIDPNMPLTGQGWYHGSISRTEAENLLRVHKEGSFLVRMSESNKEDYSLSLRGKCGYMHMKITRRDGGYVLGQFSQPYETIPGMVNHYTLNKLTIKGAEHMCLLHPVSGNNVL